jgi:hypothetical protein
VHYRNLNFGNFVVILIVKFQCVWQRSSSSQISVVVGGARALVHVECMLTFDPEIAASSCAD